MFDAIFTVAVYAAIAMGLLWAVLMIGAVVLAVVDHVREEVWGYDDLNEYQPTDFTDWAEWDWPIPDDVDGWDFPEKDAA